MCHGARRATCAMRRPGGVGCPSGRQAISPIVRQSDRPRRPGVLERQQVDLSCVEVVRIEIEITIGVPVNASCEERQEKMTASSTSLVRSASSAWAFRILHPRCISCPSSCQTPNAGRVDLSSDTTSVRRVPGTGMQKAVGWHTLHLPQQHFLAFRNNGVQWLAKLRQRAPAKPARTIRSSDTCPIPAGLAQGKVRRPSLSR